MKLLLGNSAMPTYVKIMATVLLGATYLAALGVATSTYIAGGPTAQLPSVVTTVLGIGIGTSINVLGIHTGAQLTENKGASSASTPSA